MLSKLEYLKLAINSKVIENKSWYLSCFAIPILKDETNWENKDIADIVTKPDGLYFINSEKNLDKISDYKKDQPLFSFQDIIEVDPSWGPFIKSKINTKIGNLLINALIIYPSFKNKIEYINEPIKMSNIEKMLAQKVVSDKDAKENDITVSEMITAMDRFSFLTNLAPIINIAATPKGITPPPNIDKIKKELLKEYEGKLHDTVKLVELENKLSAIDKEYLKDDIAAKNIFNNKSRTARKKMFLIYGDTNDFEKSTTARPISQSLLEGLSTSEEDFPKYMNDLRIGSYSRGTSTQLGGYTYKILQRSLSSLTISSIPCNTKRGIKRLINDSNASKLVNRYILESGKWVLIETQEQTKKYIGKIVEIRSSMYCTSEKNTVCYKCMSEVYKDSPTGVTNIASELSSVLLTMFLKLMHGTLLESTTISMDDLVT